MDQPISPWHNPHKSLYLVITPDGKVMEGPHLVLHCSDPLALPAIDAYHRHHEYGQSSYLGMSSSVLAQFVDQFHTAHHEWTARGRKPLAPIDIRNASPMVLQAMAGVTDFQDLEEMSGHPNRPVFTMDKGDTALILNERDFELLRDLLPDPVGGLPDPYASLRELLGDD